MAPTPRSDSSGLQNLCRNATESTARKFRARTDIMACLEPHNVTDDWHKRLQVCVHVEGKLSEYLV